MPATLGWVTGEWERPGRGSAGAGPARGELAVAHEFLAGGLDAWRLAVNAASRGPGFHRRGPRARRRHRHGAPPAGRGARRRLRIRSRRATSRPAWPSACGSPGPRPVTAVGPYDEALDRLLVPARRQRRRSPATDPRRSPPRARSSRFRAAAGKAPRWAILDFEGEPLRPISERNFPDVPLRDVVGMLRSFDYAAGAAVREHPDADVPESWVDDCAEAFLAGYAEVIPGSIDRDSPLFVALWLDKALYEVIYELRNRPDWLSIPVNASRRLLGSTGSGVPAEAAAEGIKMTGSARIDRPGSPTASGCGDPGEGRLRRTPRAALGPGRAPR